MDHETTSPIQRWSTEHVAPARRLDYYAEALVTAVDPMHVVSSGKLPMRADVASVPLGALTLVHASGSAHRCVRDERDVVSRNERNFHLILNTASAWRLRHRGDLCVRRGDAVLVDGQLGHAIELADFDITHLKLPEAWIRQWLRSPASLAGRVIPHDAKWGRALIALVSRLTPERVAGMPLPESALSDCVGALLALAASDLGEEPRPTRGEVALRERIAERIVQRCTEPSLAPSDVAEDLGISVRTLHRSLTADRRSFHSRLMAARVDLALRMLESPMLDRVPIAEIGRRCGFVDASHFARMVRGRLGRTPSRIRRDRGVIPRGLSSIQDPRP